MILAHQSLQIEQIAAVLKDACQHIIISKLTRLLQMLAAKSPQLTPEPTKPLILRQPHPFEHFSLLIKQTNVHSETCFFNVKVAPDLLIPAPQRYQLLINVFLGSLIHLYRFQRLGRQLSDCQIGAMVILSTLSLIFQLNSQQLTELYRILTVKDVHLESIFLQN